jgi:ABC-type nitrate/sulfonate/bicarbonate transport system substrate-binding protein
MRWGDFVGITIAGVAACAASPQVATAKRAAIEAMPELLQRVLKAIARSLLLFMESHNRPRGCAWAADQRREPVSDSGKILQPGPRRADT